jgi:hypothetical protein
MRRRITLALLLALLPLRALGAQGPRWDVWRTSVDQFGPWELTGPRIGIQAVRVLGGVETYRLLRVVHVPPRVAAPLGAFASGLAPHLIGLARHSYPLDRGDFAADAWIGGASVYLARALERKRHRVRALVGFAAGWAVAAGWASP